MSHQNKNRKTETVLIDSLKNIKESIVYLYLFLMLAVHVYYAPERFYYIATHKLRFFARVTSVFLIVALFMILLTIVLYRKRIKELLKLEMEEIVVLAYAGWNIMSYLFSTYRKEALLGYEGWRMGLLMQLALVAVFLIVKRWTGKKLPALLIAVFAFFPQCILIFVHRMGEDPFNFYEGMNYFDWNRRNLLGTIGNANWLCGYMVCVLPIVLWLYLFEEKLFIRILYALVLYVGLGALFLQGSSSGLVALGGICLFLLLFAVEDLERLRRFLVIPFMICSFWMLLSLFRVDLLESIEMNTPGRMYSPFWIIPTLLFLGVVTFLTVYIKKKKNRDIPQKVLKSFRIFLLAVLGAAVVFFLIIQLAGVSGADLGVLEKLRIKNTWGSNRILVWKETLRHFFGDKNLKNIIFGVGPDCYGLWFTAEGIDIPKEGPMQSNFYTNAHNDYLTAFVNIGLVGVFLYLSVFVLFFIRFRKEKENAFRIPGMLLILSFVLNNFFSFQQICATPVFFLLLGVLCSKEQGKEKR